MASGLSIGRTASSSAGIRAGPKIRPDSCADQAVDQSERPVWQSGARRGQPVMRLPEWSCFTVSHLPIEAPCLAPEWVADSILRSRVADTH